MKSRILTAVPLALLVLALVWWGPKWLFLLVLLAVVEISLYEYFYLSRTAGMRGIPWIGYLAGAALCAAQTTGESASAGLVVGILAVSVFLAAMFALFRADGLKDYLGSAASTVFGILYLGLTLSWLFPLRFSGAQDGRALILFLLLVNWAGDAFALLIGRNLGRHFFVPRISPRKTVEGSIAGLLGSVLVGWLCSLWFWQTAGLKTVILLAVVAAITGQIGDLVESALKRAGGLKDSGSLLPGHGGLLDRIDSLVFAVPAVWLVMVLQSRWR
jgi:phosphatidate cytidylyltransferase